MPELGGQELKCRLCAGRGGGRICINANSDSDILPSGPFPNPQDSKFELSQNDFPDQRREAGFQAQVPQLHNNSAMSRLICSILKIYIVLTSLPVWPK